MRLSKIRFRNLLAVGNSFVEIDLGAAKKTLVLGPNGSGKTGGLIEPLSFGLYNRPFRKVNRAKLINSITNKGLLVEVEFETPLGSYLVRRGMKPSVFEIYRNGILVDPPADARDYQSWLENQVLNMNFRTFCQCVILGSRNYVPFMQLAAGERRAVVENLLDIEVFTVMNGLLRSRMDASRREVEMSDRALAEVQAQIDLNSKRLALAKRDFAEMIRDKENVIAEKDEDFAVLKREAEDAHNKIVSLKEQLIVHDPNKFKAFHEDLKWVLEDTVPKLNFYKDHQSCPTCAQSITEEFRFAQVKMLQERKESILRKLAVVEDEMEKDKQNAETNFLIAQQINTANTSLQTLISKGKENRWYVQDLQKEILTMKAPKKDDDLTVDLGAREANVMALRAEILDRARVLALAVNLLKDGGVKAQMVRRFMPWLNATVNRYLEALDLFVVFEMNEQFEEKIFSRGRDDFTYENLSEGEKLRLDLAVLFAWRDLGRARASAAVNLLVLDEVLDSSMDGEGVDEFLKVMDRLSDAENVVVISHRSESVIDRFDRVLRFSKRHNFSVLEEEAA
jgi:DNA repair exonuclease SbcCD ATPase subunit